MTSPDPKSSLGRISALHMGMDERFFIDSYSQTSSADDAIGWVQSRLDQGVLSRRCRILVMVFIGVTLSSIVSHQINLDERIPLI